MALRGMPSYSADGPMPTMGQFSSSLPDGGPTALGSMAVSSAVALRLVVAMIRMLPQILAKLAPAITPP